MSNKVNNSNMSKQKHENVTTDRCNNAGHFYLCQNLTKPKGFGYIYVELEEMSFEKLLRTTTDAK